MTQQRWRALLFALMAAGLLFAIRPLTSPLEPERLFHHSDKVGHILFFSVLWLLARRAGFAAGWRLALALLAFGVGIEVAQHLVPTGRSASLRDVAADAIGLLLGWWTARAFSVGQPQEHRR